LEELVDLVDKHGRSVVLGVPRSEVRRRKEEFIAQGLFQPIVIVVVTDADDKIVVHVRAESKGDDGGLEVDHVCGVVASGEAWQEAAVREAAEEIGVKIHDLSLVRQGVNVYQRYRTLALARSIDEPKVVREYEVARVFSAHPDELRALESRGEVRFVRGFFSDLELAMSHGQQLRA
jgi:ADP-ribose pyrophosphatase YjhB (NUDIX family)